MIKSDLLETSRCDAPIELADLFEAHANCRTSKRNTMNALSFELDYEQELVTLWQEINAGIYVPGRSIAFIVDKPVKREIFAADFRDRVVHHLLINKLNPLFEKIFIYDSYACRKGRGTHFGIQRIDRFIRQCSRNYIRDCYVLKLDIQGFFMAIDKRILWKKLRDLITHQYHQSDKNTVLSLCHKVLNNNPTKNCFIKGRRHDWSDLPPDKSLFHSASGCGLPIGNLTSQIFANVYLNALDHFIKHDLGIRYYGRYVDDFVLVHPSHEHLKATIPLIADFLQSQLKLTLHPRKMYLQHYSKGVPFLGMVIQPNHIKSGKRIKGNFYDSISRHNQVAKSHKPSREEQAAFLSSINSYLGILKHYTTYGFRKRMLIKHLSAWWWNLMYFSGGCAKLVAKKEQYDKKDIGSMSLDVSGFDKMVTGGAVTIAVADNHRLVKLAQKLPWDEMIKLAIPDLQRTEKKHWWMGRPLRIRIHLGVYVLQQMFDLTDRFAEQQVRDNAAFRLFCGYGLLKKWHAPDHTKIEAFRSRLTPETQRHLANLISQQATRLGYANPAELDVDSTVQEANIAYPALVNLLVKVAIMARAAAKGLNALCHEGREQYRVGLTHLKQIALYYFNLKRKEATTEVLKVVQQRLWRETYESVLPILQNLYQLTDKVQAGMHWPLKRAINILSTRCATLLHNVHSYLFEGVTNTSISSLHATEVGCFNKGKLNKGLQFGRAFQLGRIGGNFLVVGQCTSVYMPDAQSLPAMLSLHQRLFGPGVLASVATDKGYYSYKNEQLLIKSGVADIQLPRPERTLDAPPETTPWPIRQELHDRRAGIEPLIGHTKQGGQMGRSRMKSDETTKSAGYTAVLGFNLRQLTRYLSGEVRPKNDKIAILPANEARIDWELSMMPHLG